MVDDNNTPNPGTPNPGLPNPGLPNPGLPNPHVLPSGARSPLQGTKLELLRRA